MWFCGPLADDDLNPEVLITIAVFLRERLCSIVLGNSVFCLGSKIDALRTITCVGLFAEDFRRDTLELRLSWRLHKLSKTIPEPITLNPENAVQNWVTILNPYTCSSYNAACGNATLPYKYTMAVTIEKRRHTSTW